MSLLRLFRRNLPANAEAVRLGSGTVYVVPPSARFVVELDSQYDVESEEGTQNLLVDLMKEVVVDAKGKPVCSDDPLQDFDCQDFPKIREAAFRSIRYQGDAEKNSQEGQADDS